MERLTFDGNFCDIAMCTEVPFGSCCEDGTCSQRQIWERLKMIEDVFGDEFDLDLLCELIKMTREADVAPVVRGKWVKKPVYRQDLHGKMIHFCTKYICSACNHESNTLSSGLFCPNCGTKMDLID